MKVKYLLLFALFFLSGFVLAEPTVKSGTESTVCVLQSDFERIVSATGYMSDQDRNKFLDDVFTKTYVLVKEVKDCPVGSEIRRFF